MWMAMPVPAFGPRWSARHAASSARMRDRIGKSATAGELDREAMAVGSKKDEGRDERQGRPAGNCGVEWRFLANWIRGSQNRRGFRGGGVMKPRERRETGERDLFRSRLDQIIDLRHPLVKLARETDCAFLEKTFGAAYTDGPGQPPLPSG